MASTRRTPEETELSPVSFEQADFAGGRGVRAAAELGREAVGQLDDAHLVAVLFAEQRHGVVLVHGHVDGHVFERLDPGVGQHFAVDDVLDLLRVLRRPPARSERSRSAAASGSTSEPACLTCVPSTWRSAACSRCVPVWLRRMASRRSPSTTVLTWSPTARSCLSSALCARTPCTGSTQPVISATVVLPSGDRKPAGVADLAAGVAIEAGVVENDLDLLAGFGAGTPTPSFTMASTSQLVAVRLR